jgi:tripartite-type tricarboxylate transporter receptor subunit TctC
MLKVPHLAAILACVVCAGVPAAGQDFYQGKTVRLIVGSQAGASYDSYSRILAPVLGRHIPGKPTIVVQNMPGAGGMVAANHLFNVADKDGSVIGMYNRSAVLSAIVGHPQAKFKPQEIYWLGTVASFSDNAYLFIVRSAVAQMSVEDMRKGGSPVSVGNSGSAPMKVLKDVLGFNVKVIDGYGKSELDLAFERGELDGAGIAYANLQARYPHWIEKKFFRPIVQFARLDRHPNFPDVPTAREIARTPDDLALIELVDAPFLIAYPYGLAPGIPADRAAVLRAAFKSTFDDTAFRDEARSKKLEYSPKDGAELQQIVARIGASSPAVLERYKQIVGDATD